MADTFEEQTPVFTTVDQLRPDTKGHNLVLKVSVLSLGSVARFAILVCAIARYVACVQVVNAKTVVDRPGGRSGSSPARVAECLVGDETGVIVFSAKNEQGKDRQKLSCSLYA